VAIILADSYDDHFTPLTLTTPRCLLPLANVPMLDYSIESATMTGVSHIYILTCAHTNQIREYMTRQFQASLRNQGIGITVMSTPEAKSEGDALRELDAKQVIRSDFLLYRADSVCTFDLKKAVAEHKNRRKVDKDVIMTMCCMPAQDQTSMRCVYEPIHSSSLHYAHTLFFAADPTLCDQYTTLIHLQVKCYTTNFNTAFRRGNQVFLMNYYDWMKRLDTMRSTFDKI
jgi:translation initiation factor eIF-2B subunit epsilon